MAAGLLAALPSVSRAEWLRDEIVVYADPALRPPLAALAATFRASTGVRVRIFCAQPAQMVGLLAHGTQDDILITQQAAMAQAAQTGLLSGAPKKLWRNRLVFAAAAPGPTAAAFDGPALLTALAGGKLALPDPSDASTVDGPALLARLGVAAGLSGKTLGAADSEDAVATLKRGEAAVALCHSSETITDPSLRVLMPVPDDAYDPIIYDIALSAHAWSRYQDKFIAAVTGDATHAATFLGLEILA